jgi:hypothetical protein
MARRTSRLDTPPDPANVIQGLRACRQAMIGVQAKVCVNGPGYHSTSMVMAAINAMATFHPRSGIMTEQDRQAEVHRDAIEKA